MNDFKEKLNEIGKDLRNQRLLPVIALLVVAIIAVPMVLKAGGQGAGSSDGALGRPRADARERSDPGRRHSLSSATSASASTPLEEEPLPPAHAPEGTGV